MTESVADTVDQEGGLQAALPAVLEFCATELCAWVG
jgi:hypothetical protein